MGALWGRITAGGRAATRGRRLGWLVAALVAVAASLPPVPALGTPPEVSVGAVRVDDWTPTGLDVRHEAGDVHTDEAGTGGAPTGPVPWHASPVLDSTDAVMVGAEWSGGSDVLVDVRSREDGRWSDWTSLDVVDDHAPDPGSDEAARSSTAMSDPVWIGAADAIQVRRSGGPADLEVTLHTVRMSGGDGLAYQPPEARGIGGWANAAPAQPELISRPSWGADESLRNDEPDYTDEVRFAVVHHTAGRNDYAPEEADDVVRGIYAYHTLTRGWDDIAYNFLVDRYGRVYEGRSGGITEPVIGAHAAGWNAGSTGVAVMGDFTFAEPPQAAIDALDRLLAWKLDVHHVDPFGTTEELAGGGSSNRFPSGDRLILPTIIGHRVTNSTACPGDRLIRHIVDEQPQYGYHQASQRWEPVAAHRVAPIGTPKIYGGPPAEREQPLVGTRPSWDVAFTDRLDWRLRIADAEGRTVRSTGGVLEEGAQVTWDLRGADGELVPPGRYTAELRAWSSEGEASPVVTQLDVTPPSERLGGADRVETAVLLSQWAFDEADRVVIASSQVFADALTATPLAGSLGSPVLLVPGDHVPEPVMAEIKRLAAEDAWIVGGTARISPHVDNQLEAAGVTPHRLAGPDRFATAAEVAELVIEREGPGEVLVALGQHPDDARAFPDALSAGAYGAEFDLPVLLVHWGAVPKATTDVLVSRDWPAGVRVFGGPAAVSDAVQAELGRLTGDHVHRFAGADRYDTARLAADDVLARWAQEAEQEGPNPYLDPVGLEVVFASGANWPDALGAGAAADERTRSLFLLAPPGDLDTAQATRSWLEARAAELSHALVSGGPAAIADAVVAAIGEFVASAGPNHDAPESWPQDPHEPPELLPLPGPTGTPSPSPTATG